MKHRPPTRHDIGKTVLFHGGEGILREISVYSSGDLYCTVVQDGMSYYACANVLVPYTSPDPIAELSMAADLLAESGMDEAARVLMANVESRELIDRIVFYFLVMRWRFVREHNHLGDALVALSRLIKGQSNEQPNNASN